MFIVSQLTLANTKNVYIDYFARKMLKTVQEQDFFVYVKFFSDLLYNFQLKHLNERGYSGFMQYDDANAALKALMGRGVSSKYNTAMADAFANAMHDTGSVEGSVERQCTLLIKEKYNVNRYMADKFKRQSNIRAVKHILFKEWLDGDLNIKDRASVRNRIEWHWREMGLLPTDDK